MPDHATMRSRFVDDGMGAAAPQVLLISIYDRLLLDLRRGADAQRAGDRQESHNRLMNAQAIIAALMVALGSNEWVGASKLQGLYSYMLREVVNANVKQLPDRVDACRELVEPLREAWYQASINLTAEAPASLSGAEHLA